MARPLRYDDQFVSIVNEKIHDKFLNLVSIKVQSTAFFQKLNLQQSLIVCSLIDMLIGLIIFFYFFRIMELKEEGFIYIAENILLVLGMFFGLVGFDSATNLKKRNSIIYKSWRIFITFAIPFCELIQSSDKFCYYNSNCTFGYFVLVATIIFTINLYLTKVAWSFCIRIDRNHELLIIHGKYLENMMKEENYKITDNIKKYVPPNIKQTQRDNELIQMPSTGNVMEEEIFAPRKANPFFNAIQNIKK